MSVTIEQLPLAALEALAAGDDVAAAQHFPVPLSAWLLGPDSVGTWRRRATQVAHTPADEAWVTGVVVADGVAVGRAGFHAAPDADGMLEVGYAIDPDHRRRGHARAVLGLLLDRARETFGVRTVIASVGPWNAPSLALVRRRGFVQIGEEMDDEDGLELVLALDVTPRPLGTTETRLVVLRGNTASGTSTVAHALQRDRPRDLAWVGQDLLRRDVLRADDTAGGMTVDFVDAAARFALDRGLHVMIDGLLGATTYGAMLRCLVRDHVGLTHTYLLGMPSAETVPGLHESVLGAASTVAETLARIRADTGL